MHLIVVDAQRFVKMPLSSSAGISVVVIVVVINRGYYTVARRYEFYFRVAKQYFTNERSE